MKKLHLVAYPIVLMLGFGAGSSAGGGDTITPTAVPATVTVPAVTKTVTQPAPPPVTVTAKPKPAEPPAEALTKAALDLTWSEMSSSDRRSLCDGWAMEGLQDYWLGIFLESAGDGFDRATVRAFFDKKC